jgi:hypothetical protein
MARSSVERSAQVSFFLFLLFLFFSLSFYFLFCVIGLHMGQLRLVYLKLWVLPWPTGNDYFKFFHSTFLADLTRRHRSRHYISHLLFFPFSSVKWTSPVHHGAYFLQFILDFAISIPRQCRAHKQVWDISPGVLQIFKFFSKRVLLY